MHFVWTVLQLDAVIMKVLLAVSTFCSIFLVNLASASIFSEFDVLNNKFGQIALVLVRLKPE